MILSEFAKRAEKLIGDNSPNILTAIGVGGTITTAFLTGRATLKAAEVLRTERTEDSTWKDDVKLVWKFYIPPVGMGILTISAIIFANRIGMRRAAAMAAAYSMSERAFSEYREKAAERWGKTKETDVRDDLAQDRVNKNPVSTKEVIITGNGSVLCFDQITGRYFESDMESLRKAQNDINQKILHDSYATLHDFQTLIGLSSTKYSQELGWTDGNLLELHFSTCLSSDNRPCIAIDYSSYPVREYY